MEQDWNPVVFKKVKDAVAKNESKTKEKNGRRSNLGDKLRKLDNTEIDTVDKVKLTTSRAMSKRRTELKMSQKQLAQLVNEKPEVISQYESGRAVPKQHILLKLEKILGIYLTGTKTGEEKARKFKKG